jgi:RNA polymerase sigma-70 factor (ECF subfamily)
MGPISTVLGADGATRSLDRALVERARAADPAAFEVLVTRRADAAYRTAFAILRNEADARDATQDAFLRAWCELPSLRDAERFDAWFGRILVNTCRNSMRGRRRRVLREIPVDPVEELVEAPVDVVALDDRAAQVDRVRRAFLRLTPDERLLLALHHGEARPIEEVARLLAAPAGTVKWRLFAARASLARALEHEDR